MKTAIQFSALTLATNSSRLADYPVMARPPHLAGYPEEEPHHAHAHEGGNGYHDHDHEELNHQTKKYVPHSHRDSFGNIVTHSHELGDALHKHAQQNLEESFPI